MHYDYIKYPHIGNISHLYRDNLNAHAGAKIFVTISANKNMYNTCINNMSKQSMREFGKRTFRNAARMTLRNVSNKPIGYPACLSIVECKDRLGQPCTPHIHSMVSVGGEYLDRYRGNLIYSAQLNAGRIFNSSVDIQFDEVYDENGLVDYMFKNVGVDFDIYHDINFAVPGVG